MNARGLPILRVAIALTAAGVLITLALLIRETPWTLSAFMFIAQPLMVIAFLVFVWEVIRDLRRTGLF
jgi:hypothetical protein